MHYTYLLSFEFLPSFVIVSCCVAPLFCSALLLSLSEGGDQSQTRLPFQTSFLGLFSALQSYFIQISSAIRRRYQASRNSCLLEEEYIGGVQIRKQKKRRRHIQQHQSSESRHREMSIKYCDQHKDCERQRLYRRFCAALVGVILLLLLIVLIVWLVLRPTKPRFFLNDVSIVCINVTSASYLTVTMQATLASRNTNDRVGIYYDRADVYAEYRAMQVTVPTSLPPFFQPPNDAAVWAPFLSAANVPLPAYLATALAQDETAGYLLVTIRVDGWIRWKAGAFITSHYHLRVRCPALLTVNDGHGSYGSNAGGGVGYFKFQRAAPCIVDV